MRFSPASVSVMVHGLQAEGDLTGDLFAAVNDDAADRARWENVSKTIDDLRSRFGGKALSLGQHEDMPGGYVGGKIAFGRIPEAGDFEQAAGADCDTRFCTF
jgi:DNA polymerase-4